METYTLASLGGLLRRGQRVGVAAEAVVQDRGRPVRAGHRASLTRGFGSGDGALDQRGGLRLVAAQSTEQHGGKGRDAAPPGHLADRIALRDQGIGPREVTAPRVIDGERAQIDRQLFERADGPGQLDLPDQDRALGVLVPQRAGGRLGHRAQPEPVLHGDVFAGKGAHRLPQRRGRGGRAVGDQQGKAVQQQVERAGGLFRRGKGLGGAADLQQVGRRPPGARRTVAAIHAVR